MSSLKDDWHKPRKPGEGLKAHEIRYVREQFDAGTPARDVAFALKCSTRVIVKYYGRYRSEPAKSRPTRFYKSNFDLTDNSGWSLICKVSA